MIDFPASPTVGQIFTSGGQQWMWDGTKWLPNGQINTAVVPMNDNRIINGDMRIDQRNNGASGTAASAFPVDRWTYVASQTGRGTWGRSPSSALGFPYCLGFTSSSAYASVAADVFTFYQTIEADMVSDFAWGTSGAQPVTLSFLFNSSLTGTFSGALENYAGTRSYPFSFSIPAANTWTKIAVNIPGDTVGTWVMSGNAGAMLVAFDLGSGANARGPANAWASSNFKGVTGSVSVIAVNGASVQITGVKLEIGSVATPFNRQSLTKSLADCQRYYQVGNFSGAGNAPLGGWWQWSWTSPVQMRSSPTLGVNFTTNTNVSNVAITALGLTAINIGGTATAAGNMALTGSYTATAEL